MMNFFIKTIRVVFISTLLLLLSIIQTQAQIDYHWAKGLGGSGSDVGNSITTDKNGNLYVAGNFVGTVDFDPSGNTALLTSTGQTDIFIAKYDALGNYIWAKSMGGALDDQSFSVALDNYGSVYFTGYFTGTADFDAGPGTSNLFSNGGQDIFIAKYDTAGNFVWAKSIGGTATDIAYDITTDNSGYVCLTGTIYGSVDFDPGLGVYIINPFYGWSSFILKLNSSGNFVWVTGTACSSDKSSSIKTDAMGNIYTTGNTYWQPLINEKNLEDSLNNFTLQLFNPDIFIQKQSSIGNIVWYKTIAADNGVPQSSKPSITLDDQDNIYITGAFQGTENFDLLGGSVLLTSSGNFDIFIAKYDSAANYLWAKKIGNTGFDRGTAIALDTLNNLYITGIFSGTVDFDPSPTTNNLTSSGNNEGYIAKYDNAGNYLMAKKIGGASNSIIVDSLFTISITGSFSGIVDFDPPNNALLSSNGNSDIFIAQYSTCTIVDSSSQSFTICNGESIVVGAHTYTVSGTYVDYFATSHPCDSMVTTHLTVLPSFNLTQSFTICPDTSISVGSHTYNTSGTYHDTLTAVNGCDSIITTYLYLFLPPIINTYVNGSTITALLVANSFQWLDCNNGFAPIPGATNQTFTPSVNGSYAVVVTTSICSDTSACVDITTVGTNDFLLNQENIFIFPNPASNYLTVKVFESAVNSVFEIYDVQGKQLLQKKLMLKESTINIASLAKGIYFIKIANSEFSVMKKLIKE